MVSNSQPTSFDEYLSSVGRSPEGYFYFLMAWNWEVQADESLKHQYDSLDSIYILSAKSPYFIREDVTDWGDGEFEHRYYFELPAVSNEVSKGGYLMCRAVMDEKREILKLNPN